MAGFVRRESWSEIGTSLLRSQEVVSVRLALKDVVDYFFVLEYLSDGYCHVRAVVVVDLLMVFLVAAQEPSLDIFLSDNFPPGRRSVLVVGEQLYVSSSLVHGRHSCLLDFFFENFLGGEKMRFIG